MCDGTPQKKLKFDEETCPVLEDFSIALATKVVLGEDIHDFYPRLLLIMSDFITKSGQEHSQLIQDTVKDDKYVEKCRDTYLQMCKEMLAIESHKIQDNVEDIAFKVFVTKNKLLSSNVDYKTVIDGVDREIEDNLDAFNGLITAKRLLEQKENEFIEIRRNLELCRKYQLQNRGKETN